MCYGRTRPDVELYQLGRIAAMSSPTARGGRPRVTFGFVTFEGVSGGLVHRLLGEDGRRPKVGDSVGAVFASPDKRSGSILDLQGFRTRANQRRR